MAFFSRTWSVIAGIFFVGALSRLLPHPSNFTAVQAIALFGSRWISNQWQALSIALLVQWSTDLLLGFYSGMEFVYLSLALTGICVALARPIRGYRSSLVWGFISCLGFFLLSNLGCWWKAGLYSKDAAGLLACYVAGLPFFLNHLLGTAFYSVGLESLFIRTRHGGWVSIQKGVV